MLNVPALNRGIVGNNGTQFKNQDETGRNRDVLGCCYHLHINVYIQEARYT